VRSPGSRRCHRCAAALWCVVTRLSGSTRTKAKAGSCGKSGTCCKRQACKNGRPIGQSCRDAQAVDSPGLGAQFALRSRATPASVLAVQSDHAAPSKPLRGSPRKPARGKLQRCIPRPRSTPTLCGNGAKSFRIRGGTRVVRVPPARACRERRTHCSASPRARQTASLDRPTQGNTPVPNDLRSFQNAPAPSGIELCARPTSALVCGRNSR
jgi:hypothetical protein